MTKKLVAQDVLDYEVAVGALAKAKKTEIELRNKIIGAFRYTKSEGVEHKSVDGLDIDICVTLGLRRSIDKNGLESIWSELDDQQKDTVEFKPSLTVSKFKKLVKDDEAGLLASVITEKPSQATVKLKYEE